MDFVFEGSEWETYLAYHDYSHLCYYFLHSLQLVPTQSLDCHFQAGYEATAVCSSFAREATPLSSVTYVPPGVKRPPFLIWGILHSDLFVLVSPYCPVYTTAYLVYSAYLEYSPHQSGYAYASIVVIWAISEILACAAETAIQCTMSALETALQLRLRLVLLA